MWKLFGFTREVTKFKVEKWEMVKIANLGRLSGLRYVQCFQRWSRGNDKECKLFCTSISFI